MAPTDPRAATLPVHDLVTADARMLKQAIEVGHSKIEATKKTIEELRAELAADAAMRDGAIDVVRRSVTELAKVTESLRSTVAAQSGSIGDLAEQVGRSQATVAECAAAVAKLAEVLEVERIERRTADKRIEGKVAVVQTRTSLPDGAARTVTSAVSTPDREGSLAGVNSWEEITHATLAKAVLNRAQDDADFAREAARAGLGLRVTTWKSVLKWIGIIIVALTAGTGIGAAIQQAIAGDKTPPALPR